jgi:hypothetical protein
MSNVSTAKTLTFVGVILTIVLAFIEIGWAAVNLFFDLTFYFPPIIDPWDIVAIIGAIIALIISFIIYIQYLPKIEVNPKNTGIYLIIFGAIGAVTAYFIGGILILVAGILLMMESEGEV